MTTFPTRSRTGINNGFVGRLQKQFPELLPPLAAIAIFLILWQLFSMAPGATLPGPVQVIQDTWILIFWPFYDRGLVYNG